MLRGNAGQAIVADDADRQRLCELLAEGVERFDHRIHAYCLMGNHLHLAIEVGSVSLSRVIQNLAFRYTRSFNRRERRTGHLFQGRFRALLVQRDSYLLELVRYIHCNPVRSGLVKSPEAWTWSGHRAYLGRATTPWLTTDLVLSMLSESDPRLARRRYAGFIREGLGEAYREDFHRWSQSTQEVAPSSAPAQTARGDKALGALQANLGAVIAEVCRSLGVVEADLIAAGRARPLAKARALVGWLAQEAGAATLTEVARRFGRDVATLSRQVAQLRVELRGDAHRSERARDLCLRLAQRNNATTQA